MRKITIVQMISSNGFLFDGNQKTELLINCDDIKLNKDVTDFNNINENKDENEDELEILANKIFEFDSNYFTENNKQELVFHTSFNKKLEKSDIKKNTNHLIFNSIYNKSIEPYVLSKKIISIKFGNSYNKPIPRHVLPKRLKKLYFGSDFNQVLEEMVLPEYLEELVFGINYNQKLNKNVLPSKLKKLEFGDNFNQTFTYLPNELSLLGLGKNYDKLISEKIYPLTLKTIKLYGSSHNKYVFDNLPNFLEIVIFTNLETPITNLPMSIDIIQLINYNENTIHYIKYSHGVTIIDSKYKILNKNFF